MLAELDDRHDELVRRARPETKRLAHADAPGGRAATAPPAADPARDAALAASCPLPAPPARLRDLERQAIERTLAALDGNVAATARQLGISRNTIYRRRNGGSD